jgi:cysteine desulfurase
MTTLLVVLFATYERELVSISQHIYLDNHASTRCDPRVVDAMLPYFSEKFANPSSSQHRSGRDVANAITVSRQEIADTLGGDVSEIVFTSGATESNNLGILGSVRYSTGARRRVFVSAVEHPSVLACARSLASSSIEVVVIPVDRFGTVDLDWLKEELNESVLLVSVQAANNEIGTIQPISKIVELAHHVGAIAHCDAAQAFGKLQIDVRDSDLDLLSVSAHKLYGPKGVGALYVKHGVKNAAICPLQYGGNQESGLRPGTLNVPAVVGFGVASRIAREEMQQDIIRTRELRNRLETAMLAVGEVRVNGDLRSRLVGSLSLTLTNVDAEALIANVPEIAFSSGAACSSGSIDPSTTLLAIGLSRKDAFETIRMCVGRFTTEPEIDCAAQLLTRGVAYIRSVDLSPDLHATRVAMPQGSQLEY